MIHRSLYYFFALIIIAISISSCEEKLPDPIPFFDRNSGVYFTQEGLFNVGSGSLGFYNYETDSLTLDAYADVNMESVGSILQGAVLNDKEFFLVVNGSSRITEVNIEGPLKQKVYEGIPSPNYMLKSGDKEAIVTDLFGPYLYKLNLKTGLIIDSVNVGGGTGEAFIDKLGKIFVAKTSDFGAPPSNQILVVDLNSFDIVDTVEVGFNPIAMVNDVDGFLWVHCNGNTFEGRKGGLYRFNPDKVHPDSILVIKEIPFPDADYFTPSRIVTNATKTRIYFLKKDVYSIGYRDDQFPNSPFIPANDRSFYGLGFRPDIGDIYIGVEDFNGDSRMIIFDNAGNELKSFETNVGLNHFYF